MPYFNQSTPPPPRNDVPVHRRVIDFANSAGSGFKDHKEMKDRTQQNKEGMQHESDNKLVPGEHREMTADQEMTAKLNEKYADQGVKFSMPEHEQSEEYEQSM